MKPAPARPASLFALLSATLDAWVEDKALRLSAALAYYSVFSIAPLLVVVIAIGGWLVGRHQGIGQRIEDEIKAYVGDRAGDAVTALVHSALHPSNSKIAAAVGFVTLLFAATGMFSELKDGLDTIWEVRRKPGNVIRGFLRDRVIQFGMVLVIGFLLLTSLALNTAMTLLTHWFTAFWDVPTDVWRLTGILVSLLVVTVLFAMIFKILPDARIHWRDVWMGAFLTAILFELGKQGLSWYLGRETIASAYGAAGSIALLLLWVYYASCILYFGAEFTRVYALAKGRVILPSSNAVSLKAWLQTLPIHEGLSGAMSSQAPQGKGAPPPVAPRLAAFWSPVLKYLEARGVLLSIEASDALRQALGALVIAVAGGVAIFAGWLLLATAAVGLLMYSTGWPWTWATALTGGIHVLAAVILFVWMRHRLSTSAWFAETIREFKKDRAWLGARTTKI